MKYLTLIFSFLLFLNACTFKKDVVYLNSADRAQSTLSIIKSNQVMNIIEIGDVLKIDVQTFITEASVPYNKVRASMNSTQNIQILQLEGYLVNDSSMINFPVLGKIQTEGLTLSQLENKITLLLLSGGHLTNHTVKVRRLNSKFTILGEVKSAGTFSFFDKSLNIFQALGYAGDLTIAAKRNDITLIREVSGLRKIFKVNLTRYDILNTPYYQIKNNDVIIVNPSFSKVKSAGFIGSATSIASISSLLLSITLLILSK